MYRTSLFVFLLCVFFVNLAAAQNLQMIQGTVKDSIGNPIAAASVTIVNNSGAGIHFGKTNDKGKFECNFNNNNEDLAIKVGALGYQPFILALQQKNTQQLEIVLKQNIVKLHEVTIQSKTKISLSSDTLKYSVKGFQESNDRVIADVINRLPGIQIDENGGIKYNGKSITNVYIDGDNLLDGRYKMTTNNIPVGSVQQVQVIERDQPIKALNGYVNSNNVSLNIKLTDSARTSVVNTGYIGAGNNAYHGELNNLTFRKKIKSINTLKANNIGQNLEAEQSSLGVSFNNETELKIPQTYLSMESGSLPNLQEKYYLMNNDYSGSMNMLLNLGSDWGLRFNLSSLQLKRKYQYNNLLSYFLGNADTVTFNELQDNIYKLNQWHAEAQIEKNSKLFYLKSITKFEIPKWNRYGNTKQNEQQFEQNQPTKQYSLSNETQLVKALGVDRVLQYNSVLQYYNVDENLKISPGIQADIVNNGDQFLSLNQQVGAKNIFINQTVSLRNKFNRLVLSALLGASFERNQLQSTLYKTDTSNTMSSAGNGFLNDLKFDQLALFGKVSALYSLKNGSIQVEINPTMNVITYRDALQPLDNKKKYLLTNPSLEFRKNVGKYHEINARLSLQTEFGQANDVYNGTILVNYRQFNANSIPLPQSDIGALNIRYSYRRPLEMLFYNIGVTASRTRQNYINSYIIDSGLTKSVAIDFRNIQNQYALNGNISKYLFFIETNATLNFGLSFKKGFNYYNTEITPFQITQINTGLTLRKKLFNKITLSLAGDLNQFSNQQQGTGYSPIVNETSIEKIKGEWLHNISQELSYTVGYNFISYRQTNNEAIKNHFLDAKIKFAPSKWKSFFEFECTNLLNQRSYQQINSTANQLSVYQMPIRARTFMVKYSFSL